MQVVLCNDHNRSSSNQYKSVLHRYRRTILTECINQSERVDCLSLSPSSGTILGRPMAKLTAQRRQTSPNVPKVTTSTAGRTTYICKLK